MKRKHLKTFLNNINMTYTESAKKAERITNMEIINSLKHTTLRIRISMYVSMWLFSSVILAGFCSVLKSLNMLLKNGDLSVIIASVAWAIYCFCKGCFKYNNIKF